MTLDAISRELEARALLTLGAHELDAPVGVLTRDGDGYLATVGTQRSMVTAGHTDPLTAVRNALGIARGAS